MSLNSITVSKLRAESPKAEIDGRLTAAQLAIIFEQGWFKLFVPQYYGGLELTIPEGVRLEEELAWVDGSLGWTVTLCGGANWFVGFFDPEIAETIFPISQVCFGGSGMATGWAVPENGGYRVSGKWRYATGAPHLTHFTANCMVEPDNPQIKSFVFPRKDVQIIEDWQVYGLRATASHAFEVDQLWVDERQAFTISPATVTINLPVYHYPFVQFAEVTLAANTLGMARHFLDCCAARVAEMGSRNGAVFSTSLEMARVQLQAARGLFYRMLDRSWSELSQRGSISEACLQAVTIASRTLVEIARQMVTRLYPYCGMQAAHPESEINRVWRDIFTASQHGIFRPR